MKWFLKTAFREARHTQFRGLVMLFSMVFGLTVLISFSSIKQGFQDNFYTIATLLTGGDLRVEVYGQPTERFRRLLPKLGDTREAYWSLAASEQNGNPVESVRIWLVQQDPLPVDDIGKLKDTQLPDQVQLSIQATERQLQIANLSEGDKLRLNGGLEVVVSQVSRIDRELLPVWTKRLQGAAEARILATSTITSLLVSHSDVPWDQVWVFHFDSDSVRERIARARYILGYLMEENQGIRMIPELPDETGFYYSFQLISNTLFLAAFSALMLGTLAYTVTFVDFSRGKTHNVALLRCLGGSRMSSWSVYGTQVLFYGIFSILLAAVISIGIQILLPKLITQLSEVTLHSEIYWHPLLIALGFGGCFMLLPGVISIMPLLGCEPVEVLRSTKVPAKRREYRWIQSILISLTAFLALGFCVQMIEDGRFAMIFLVTMVIVFTGLFGGVIGLRYLFRKAIGNPRNYALKQAAANLYRSGNHYVFSLTAISFGLFLITFLYVFFEGFAHKGIGEIAGYASVEDDRITQYLVWLQHVFFINQWMGVILMVVGVLAVFVLLTAQRRTRLYESVILGTLGAPSAMIRNIMVYESVLAGVITAILGLSSGLLLGSIIFGIFFDIPIIMPWLLFITIFPLSIGVMVAMGFSNMKGILGYPPLEVLRKRRHFSNW